ncbi:MAG: hypothetical protein ACYS8Z_09390 [Planctomycetota bacterium]|jgi:hypothetical protein
MHTIDLLRGRGIPAKTTFLGIFLMAVTILAPLCGAAVLVERYFTNEAFLEVQSHQLALKTKELDSYSAALREREAMARNKRKISNLLTQIAEFTEDQIQWSPIFTTLAENMPEKMIVTSLEAVRKNTSVIVPGKDGSSTRVTVPKRSLVIDVAGKNDEDHDESIMKLRNELANSAALAEKLDDVVISHGAGDTAEKDTVSYEVVCVFEKKE